MDSYNIMDFGNLISPIFKEICKSKKWSDLFVNVGENVRNFEHDEGELFDQINILFSKENLLYLAKESKDSGYELIEQLRNQLISFFYDKDLYTEERRVYIDAFIEDFRNQLMSKFPEIYDRVFLNDFRFENKRDHSEIFETIHGIVDKIDELKTVDAKTMSCYELNKWYMSNTKNKCSLELFNHENKEFANELLSQISKSIINIKGENVFETVAYVAYLFMNDVRYFDFRDKLRIVDDEESWKKLSISDFSNYIFINRFNNIGNLEVIEGNKCIFVYGKYDYSKSTNFIELEKRFYRNLNDKISQCGFDQAEASDISRTSRNNYTILMRRLLLGKQKEPIWANKDLYPTLLPAMIINQWLDKDAIFFELLFDNGEKYNDYIAELAKINNIQDPFFIVHRTWYKYDKYMVSDPEDVWDFFGDLVDNSLFKKLEPMIDLILGDIDPKFELPVEKHYYASILGHVPNFSNELKNGFIETLIYLSRPESKIRYNIKNKIKDILKNVENKKEWFSISEILPTIFEINPDAVLRKIEEDVCKDDSGLVNLFLQKSDSFFTGTNYYTNIIWTLEKALYSENYVYKAIVILSKLMDLDIKHKISNSPLNTLYNALVAWDHQYIYSIEEKIEYVKYIVENTKTGWLLLSKLLPSNSGGFISSLSRPKYTSYLISDELKSKQQIFDTYNRYYNIALGNIKGNVDNLCVFYEDTMFFNFGIYETLKTTTIDLVDKFTDQEKYVIFKKVYGLISRNRHFQNADWALSERNIKLLENEILNEIRFEDETYKHQYIFESHQDILLNPVVFNSDDGHTSIFENRKLEDELRRNSIKKLVELNINWSEFLRRLPKESSNSIGTYLAELKNDITFIEDITKSIVEERPSILVAYFDSIYSLFGLDVFKKVLENNELNEKRYLELMFSRVNLNEATVEFLDKLCDEQKEIFWKVDNNAYRVKQELKDYALDNYLSFRNVNMLLELANHFHYSTEKLIEVLEVARESRILHHHMTSYHIESIFEKIYEDNFPKMEVAQQVMNLEIYFINILDDRSKVKYLRYNLSIDPNLSAELIKYAYKSEEIQQDKALDEGEKRLAEISHSILFSMKFSPTNDGVGMIEYSKLSDWCSEFIKVVSENNQRKIGLQYLGKFLSNTNILEEGEFPQESVKRVIEELYDVELSRGFIIEIQNNLGVRTISDGSGYLDLARKYKNYAQNSKMYPNTQNILNMIYDSFHKDYETEKESAKYED